MHAIPSIIPIITFIIVDICKASGIKSKLSIAVISPDAKDNMKLRNLFEVFLNFNPIMPPRVVPNVPKNKPNKVVFNKSSTIYLLIYNFLVRFICLYI